MSTLEETIREIEQEIASTPYNKASQHHIGKLKAKLAQMRDTLIKRSSKSAGYGFAVKKSGNATVGLLGFPSVGKSTLLNVLTSAKSQIGAYEFTTLDVIPGTMEYGGVKIQILDLPGIIIGASGGRGRGREILSVVRGCDLILVLLDVFNVKHTKAILNEIYTAGIRLDEKPPKVSIKKRMMGGVHIMQTTKLKKIDHKMIKDVMNTYNIHNADIVLREDVTIDRFIDAVRGNCIYIPSVVAINKIDMVSEKKLNNLYEEYFKEYDNVPAKDILPISAESKINIDVLKDQIFKKLDIIRVYLKPQGKSADLEEPLIIKRGYDVGDVCDMLHADFKQKFRYAKVWGKSAKFEGQVVGLGHDLEDGDILSIIKDN